MRTGALEDAPELVSGSGLDGFELITTPRALAQAPLELARQASAVHEVQRGPVDQVAGSLVDSVRGSAIVALGGGRVIDTAKAIAAVKGARVAAIPTTLSGAEITAIHRLPEGHRASRLVRPVLAVCDPEWMTTLPEPELRASAMNALAHGADSLSTPLSNPVATMAALRGAELIAKALDQATPKRDVVALTAGAVLSAWALDSALFGLHHVVCQTLVRALSIPHAETNAAMLPRTMEAMVERAPAAMKALAAALGTSVAELGARIEGLGGGPWRLRELGAEEGGVDAAVEAMLARPELAMTPDPPGADELRELVWAAW
ncbi:MAG: maleylacetate reductase [Solirubrobacterales bacterium]|nr:maleylacetate reductase [Solirubrobacterales bacterium]